ncbi:hypothetical protein KBTX_03824 [wastewater metagenome]|uniref:VWFA domain-containing protein n=3 Tax=root TaxID=1 RepID=A0A5B8RHJ9_9ZZZZ|nr:VWA domain-containing protein [Arhodomonas aquaeolei]MCS4503776.1 VWA domain-containing protein [Arhodomonas aquaeolei]QEA07473.1 hypothetical protein KBTEX_03824 [uncultured organism]
MEEVVGLGWHRVITRLARRDHPEAAVALADEQARLGLVLRALGGDAGLRVTAATPRAVRARRRWLERVAGTGHRHPLAWRDGERVCVPERIACFPDAGRNRDLYLWLIALASRSDPHGGDWFTGNQAAVRRTLAAFPGLTPVYRRLVAATLAARRDPDRLGRAEGRREAAIRAALEDPGSRTALPAARGQPEPVPVWLYPAPETGTAPTPAERDDDATETTAGTPPRGRGRKAAEYVEDTDGRSGLIVFRLESLFSWSEYVPVDRTVDDSEDEDAPRVAEDLDRLSLSRTGTAPASRLRLDLDLPAAGDDDTPLGDGRLLPEWDWRRGELRPRHCRVVPLLPRDAAPMAIPTHLAAPAARLRRRFEALRPERYWQRRQASGRALDLPACIEHRTARRRGRADTAPRLWADPREQQRDLACLVLADLSLSTEAWVDDDHQVIEVVRDSLHLLGEALDAGGDRFAMYGFSSRRRSHVRFSLLKNFAEPWGETAHGRIHALRPGYYTRMGAAVRQATEILAEQPASQRLLLLLTDGKPNDLDVYEGRYGLEDTRHALLEARRAGVTPFCVTIDQEAADYLPYLFGQRHHALLHRAQALPELLPRLYLLLTEATA